ncbi:MAG TPA: hypothetical protein VN843_05010, partial [Anaerolineales bacterium]|nr:hypothetical protein [Anaerolineales bacterium]
HALSNENSVTADKLARIATQCHDRSELIKKFCQHILKPEFEACLKVPFVILLTDQNETQNCVDLSAKTRGFYSQLQKLISNHDNQRGPFILEASKLDPTSDSEIAARYQTLDRAAFMHLSVSQDLQLSVGIMQETESELVPDPEDAKALCTLLSHYLRPTIFENMLKIWPRWAELRATRTSTARLCRVVGQELKYMLPAREQEERSWPEDSLSRLWSLADDLSDTGDLLRDLEERRWGERLELVSMREIAEMAWRWITHDEENPQRSFAMIGDCLVEGDRRDLDIAVSRLLHWLAQRRAATPIDEEPLVTVRCSETSAGPSIVFEDKSQRLHKKLREEMFATFSHAVPVPFNLEFETTESAKSGAEDAAGKSASKLGRYLPLYLAQMLIEGRYHGTLEDHSDDEDLKDRKVGHRVVMQFPPLERKETL